MKQRGKGDPRNAWGNQGRGGNRDNAGNQGRGPPTQRPTEQNPPPPNFADSDAFGPPLGGRARANRTGAQPGAQQAQQARAPQGIVPAPVPTQSAWGNQPSTSAMRAQPAGPRAPPTGPRATPSGSRGPPSAPAAAPPSSGNNQATGPSAWDQKKRTVESTASSGSAAKYHSDERTRGESARGAIHGNREERNEAVIKTRPDTIQKKQGSSGTSFEVKANYFALKSSIKWEIYQYHVEFVPEIENAAFRNSLLLRQSATLGGFLYDRGANIFTIRQLENDTTEIVTRDRDEREILIKIKRVGLISPLENRSIQVLNIIMKKALKELNLQQVSRDYFDPAARIEIRQHGIELWPGYTTSIRQHEKSLLMMAEVKHKLMRTETLLSILNRCYNESRQNYKQLFQQQVLGMIVLTRYNNKTYRISDVLFDITPQATFETRDGPISYIDYYKNKRQIIIKDERQPLLVSTPTERDVRGARGRDEEVQQINLVPELCTPTGYTDEMRKNFRLMKDVSDHTRVGPSDRIRKLIAFNQRLQTTERSVNCFRDWSLNLDRDLVKITARQLQGEDILLGNRKQMRAERGDWTRAFQGTNEMFRSQDLPEGRWVAIIPENMKREGNDFINMLLRVSQGMRFIVGMPKMVFVADDRSTTLSNALARECTQNPKLILVAVSNNQAERYSTIKKVCSVQYAVPSQVVTRRVMDGRDNRRMMSVATKVAIQMNSKIGGLPWNLDVKVNGCMFIGYDVCHDTRDRARSYGALVATMDLKTSESIDRSRPFKFFSTVTAHTNGEELSNNLSLSVIKAMHEYRSFHGKLPDRILFYRDGVGEGQTNYVFQHELRHLLSTLQHHYGEGVPVKLGFIIVSKRINTKFFTSGARGEQNVPAGTVVDDVVTMPERYDFFLVSQHVNQGTATPTNYNVIYDTFGLPPDLLQKMTYKMCHLYFNWSGTTRVPAVCQYAHKLAFLVGNYLHQAPSNGLSDFLYFL